MAWDVACCRGCAFAGVVPVAGSIWWPPPDTRRDGPDRMRRIHGLSQAMVPLARRMIARRVRPGDVLDGRAVRHGNADQPDRVGDAIRWLDGPG